ncbi:unnamed protein product [Rotaria sordida]|uniref:Amidohydrolase-related domain-containing protein n=1 Tax=Rotaria sordida TaxID=392033 RepID=A0A819KM49_9BILA|nr:unnamed protein product [Rotaria sordida]
MIVLTGGTVYGLPNSTNTTPENVCTPQRKDVVIAAGKILAMMDPSKTASFIDSIRHSELTILPISVEDQLIIPGLIDVHVHAIGGGGEQGPYSRTPESRLSELIRGGLTTIVGVLGTDGVTRRSHPKYDSSSRLISYGMDLPDSTLRTIQTLVLKYSWPVEEAIQFSTSNPATYLNLAGKGFLAEGYDADIVVLNQTDLTPLYVIGKGQILKTPTWIKRGMFELISE